MARDSSNEVQYYYDYHPTEEDLMGETSWHANLVDYLKAVLSWLFHGQVCTIHGNLNFYQTLNPREYPLAPDLVIIKGLEFKHKRSWAVGKTGPTPQVIFEVLSEETWKGEMVKITPNQQGWLWSEQLESWLVPDETYLRLYDREHRLRLTGEEAQARLAEEKAERAEEAAERARKEAERAEEAIKRTQILTEKLRSLGIDPETL